MKVKFQTSIASATFSYRPGLIADIEDDLASAWIASGICTAVIEVPEVTPAPKKAKKGN